ncbi:MAG: hypothetical protein ACK47O_05765, partial [Betaproteobacteria bacterium]
MGLPTVGVEEVFDLSKKATDVIGVHPECPFVLTMPSSGVNARPQHPRDLKSVLFVLEPRDMLFQQCKK